jgi:RNA polymerase sigma-70 factor (ECF subfamily)
MGDETDNFRTLLTAARNGDACAMNQLVDRYEPALRIVARVRLGAPLRPYLDSVDLVQSVHRSLMMGLRDDRFAIEKPDQLIALALTIVRRKIARHWRKMRRQKSASIPAGDSQSTMNLLQQLTSSEPDPLADAGARDSLERLFEQLNANEQRLIELRLCGFSTREAADELGIPDNVARVHLHRLRKRLQSAGILADLV